MRGYQFDACYCYEFKRQTFQICNKISEKGLLQVNSDGIIFIIRNRVKTRLIYLELNHYVGCIINMTNPCYIKLIFQSLTDSNGSITEIRNDMTKLHMICLSEFKLKLAPSESAFCLKKCLLLAKHQLSWSKLNFFQKKVLLFLNPFSGNGKAEKRYDHIIKSILDSTSMDIELYKTKYELDAYFHIMNIDLVDLLIYRAIFVASGDGIINEVVNAIRDRNNYALFSEASDLIDIPIAHIPVGSSNATASSIAFSSGLCSKRNLLLNAILLVSAPVSREFQLWGTRHIPVDALLVDDNSGRIRCGILSVTWGLVADIDIGTECFRFLGGFRNSLGAFKSILKNKKRKVEFSYLTREIAETMSVNCNTWILPNMQDDLPEYWIKKHFSYTGISIILQTHLASDCLCILNTDFGCGFMTAIIQNENTSRLSILDHLRSTQNGLGSRESKDVEIIQIVAFRLIPKESKKDKSFLVLDGEELPYGPIQGQIETKKFKFLGGPRVRYPHDDRRMNLSLIEYFPSSALAYNIRT